MQVERERTFYSGQWHKQKPNLCLGTEYFLDKFYQLLNEILKHCATSRKVAGSIPDGVIGIFH